MLLEALKRHQYSTGYARLIVTTHKCHTRVCADILDVTRTPKNGGDIFRLSGKCRRRIGGPKAAQWGGLGGRSPPQEQGPGPYGPIRYHIDLNYY